MSLRATPAAPAAQIAIPGAAPLHKAILAQTRAELTMTLRRGESVLATVIIPAGLLFFAMTLGIAPAGRIKPIDFFLPGMLAAAIMSTGMVSLGIATAYERYYGVLKRLGSSPLPRRGLIVAKILSVLAVELLQVILLVAIAAGFYGWRPPGSPLALLAALGVVLLGTATFAGLGMLMAGALRAEATLAAANGLYLLFLLLGGTILPVDHLPGVLQAAARVLPAAALSDALRGALVPGGAPLGGAAILLTWGAIFLVAAALTFKWE